MFIYNPVLSCIKMKLIKIKVSELKPDSKQPRKIFSGLKELASSIKHKGQLSPIIITNDYEILDGHRRYFAAKDSGIEYLNAVVTNNNKMTTFLKKAFPFAVNVEREGFKAWDMAESIYNIYWNYFLEEYTPKSRNDNGYSEFAKYMGLGLTTVNTILKTYKVAKKSNVLHRALKNKNISFSTLREIATTPIEDHLYYISIADKEMSKPKLGRSFMRDKIRDERYKVDIDRKDEISKVYMSRLKNTINVVNSLLTYNIIKIADPDQNLKIKKLLKPIAEFYKRL